MLAIVIPIPFLLNIDNQIDLVMIMVTSCRGKQLYNYPGHCKKHDNCGVSKHHNSDDEGRELQLADLIELSGTQRQ